MFYFLIKQNFYIVYLILLLLIMDLTQQQWISKQKIDSSSMILDVRTKEEYHEGHIPGAILIDVTKTENFVSEIQSLDKSLSYYVYCRSGQRSSKACYLMSEVGIENGFNLLGGILEWKGDLIKLKP